MATVPELIASLDASANRADISSTQMYGVANGPASGPGSQISTDSGFVPSLAKFLFDNQTNIDAARQLPITYVIGDGSTNNRTAWAAAVAAGKPVFSIGVSVVSPSLAITVPIINGASRIFSDSSDVTIANGFPILAEWFGNTTGYADRAVNALPAAGGVVDFSVNATAKAFNHAYNGGYLSKANVTLRGQKMPQLAADCRSLQGGTILRGMLQVYADNFEIRDIGIDMGKTTLDQLYGGTTAPGMTEAAVFTYPSDAIKAASPLKRGVKWHNVIALGPAPDSPTHALILGEGADDVTCSGDVIGAMASHTLVIKCSNVKAEKLCGYLSNTDGLIGKSDAQASAICRDVQIDSLVLRAQGPSGVTPYMAATPTSGLLLEAAAGSIDKFQVGQASIVGYPSPMKPIFGGNFLISGVTIDSLATDQFGLPGTIFGLDISSAAAQGIRRWRIGTLEARNGNSAARFAFSQTGSLQNHVSVGAIYATAMTACAVEIGSQSYVDIGVVSTDACADAVYRITGTPKLSVGQLFRDTATPNVYSSVGGGLVPALIGTWTQIAANDAYGVDLLGGRVSLRGLLLPGANNQVLQLPLWARPLTTKRFLAQGNNGVQTSVPVTVGTDGIVRVNEIAGGTANCSTWLSLSGISYDQQA